MTTPPAVETPSRVSSSRIRISDSCAVRLTVSRVLHARPLQEPVDRLLGRTPERTGRRRREAVEIFRQPLLEPSLDVDVPVELVDDVDRERLADVLVVEHLRARVHPGVGVDRLALDPDGQRPDDEDQRTKGDQAPDQDRPRAGPAGPRSHPEQPSGHPPTCARACHRPNGMKSLGAFGQSIPATSAPIT